MKKMKGTGIFRYSARTTGFSGKRTPSLGGEGRGGPRPAKRCSGYFCLPIVMVIVVCWACLAATAAWAAENDAATEAYLIGAGDQLEVSVWKVPDLTKQLSVLPDGKIAFPLIGQVQAAGKTIAQLQEEIKTRLVPFVPDPVLSVVVLQVNSLMVYVIGRVNQPGRFILNSDVDVLQALSMAGGLNSFAKRGDIRIFRKNAGEQKIFEFDYDEVSAGNNMAQNIVLTRGDVVVVR